jgi:uncharacterized repeat protein (TIGR03803 family)
MKLSTFGKIACIIAVFCVTTAVASYAQTYEAWASFFESNGNAPTSALVQGTNGSFYGATTGGGDTNCSDTWQFFTGCGTVFEVAPYGSVVPIHLFCSSEDCADGALPMNAIQATDGDVYGTTYFGGKYLSGAFFRITSNGEFTAPSSFCSAVSKCEYVVDPNPIIEGRDGNFYGTTIAGGTNSYYVCEGYGYCGTVFTVTAAGKLTTLYNFCAQANCADGALPTGALVQGTDGNFYGTTGVGLGYFGAVCTHAPCGTIFKVTPTGTLTTLYSFCPVKGCHDGGSPTGGLVELNGRFYGTAMNPGTIFSITPDGKFTELHRFCLESGCPDGQFPSPLTLGNDGNLYGTTEAGGANTNCSTGGFTNGCGTIFQITPEGKFTTLYNFCSESNCADGYSPYAGLAQGTDGTFYGTATFGGDGTCTDSYHYGTGCGVVYNLATGLGPFVEAQLNFGKAGQAVNILGNNLTGTTNVTFNGTAAKFEVVSSTYLKAEVPSGATTGTIEVTTPSGTLSSNVAFQVLQ